MIKKNSEILFIYDAKGANPNGDMDNENKPRMDYDTNTNLVTDTRLKRYIRDYAEMKDREIFITNKAKDATDRIKKLGDVESALNLIDVKLFGAVIANKEADSFTGPVQFNWGYSLNPVELQDSSTITSSFSSGTGIGKDYRVNYSLIAFNGSINANVSQKMKYKDDYFGPTKESIDFLDEAMIKSIPANRTRSKIGQTPRLYMRVELKDNLSFLNDLREFVCYDCAKTHDKLRHINDITLDLSKLLEYLKASKDKIDIIYMWKDINLSIKEDHLDELVEHFTVKELEY